MTFTTLLVLASGFFRMTLACVPTIRQHIRDVFYGWWVLFAAISASAFVSGVGNWTLTILISPMSQDLGWSHTQILGSLTVAGFSGALISPLVGRIVDRQGARRIITISLLGLGLGLVLTARIQTIWQFYALYAFGLGLSSSAVSRVGAQAIASNWFIRKRGMAFGAIMAGSTISGVAFTLVSQGIVERWDWRMVWLILGLAILLVPLPLAWLVIRRRPEDIGLQPDGEATPEPLTEQARADYLATTGQAAGEGWTLREAARTRTFWLLNGGLLLIGFPSSSIIVVMHPYFTELGVSPSTAAQLVSFYAISSFIGALLWGMLLQRFLVCVMLVPSTLAHGAAVSLFVVLGGFASVPLLYISVLLLGLGIMGISQIGNQVWADYYGRKEVGTIIGTSKFVPCPWPWVPYWPPAFTTRWEAIDRHSFYLRPFALPPRSHFSSPALPELGLFPAKAAPNMEDSAGSSPSCLFSSNREAADEIVPTKSAPAAAVIVNGSGPPFHPVVDCSLEKEAGKGRQGKRLDFQLGTDSVGNAGPPIP